MQSVFTSAIRTAPERKEVVRRVSGRNQLLGRIDSVRSSGLMAEVKVSTGGTADYVYHHRHFSP
jgi:hypothetical protein